jgi:thymidylate synthase
MAKNIPILVVKGNSLAEAYEKALISLYENGVEMSTQYDKEGDPKSLDATMTVIVNNPCADPMISKVFPGGIADLKEYVMELQGYKDHWCKNMNDPDDKRWLYTYSGRLTNYGVWKELVDGKSTNVGHCDINQIENIIEKLCKQPHTRQAQAITWMPELDADSFDPPCLQSLFYRILEDDDGTWWLNCNVRFRSNDLYDAHFMNAFGFIFFNKEIIADEIAKRTGKTVKLGRMCWFADSMHIYGHRINDFKEKFYNKLKTTKFEDRVYNLGDEMIAEMYNEAEADVLRKIKEYDETHTK